MKLRLPSVTLVAIDTACHALTRQALLDTLDRIAPAETLIFSDKDLNVPGARTLPCAARSNEAAERFVWYGVPSHVRTPHALFIQWDGWVLHPELWTDRFLDYDYIGAPWTWYETNRIGNGGFSLRSKRLMDALATRPDVFPFHKPEDDAICRHHRPMLEQIGMRWPDDEAVAARFACEAGDWLAFGFHGLWKFADVLPEDVVVQRMAMMDGYQFKKDEYRVLLARAFSNGKMNVVRKGMALGPQKKLVGI